MSTTKALTWSPNSIDLNPIEHLCDVLDTNVGSMETPPRNLHVQDLKDLMLTSWCQMPKHTFRGLMEYIYDTLVTKKGKTQL